MSPFRHLDVNHVNDVAVVHFRTRKIIEDLNIQEMGKELFELVEQDGGKKFVLSFSSVDFLSSAALGKLISLNNKMKSHSAKMKLCCIRPEIYDVFRITRLDRIFDIKKDEADALATF